MIQDNRYLTRKHIGIFLSKAGEHVVITWANETKQNKPNLNEWMWIINCGHNKTDKSKLINDECNYNCQFALNFRSTFFIFNFCQFWIAFVYFKRRFVFNHLQLYYRNESLNRRCSLWRWCYIFVNSFLLYRCLYKDSYSNADWSTEISRQVECMANKLRMMKAKVK